FDDPRAVAVQMAFQIQDGAISVMPDLAQVRPRIRQAFAAQDFRMHSGDQDFLVVGAVEDSDPSKLGQVASGPPEKVMLELGGARMLEAEPLAALRIDSRHDVSDGAVLSRRV